MAQEEEGVVVVKLRPQIDSRGKGPPAPTGVVLAAAVGVLGLGLAGSLARTGPCPPSSSRRDRYEIGGRRLDRSAAMLAASVVADSVLAHFRGNYHNRAMYAAPAVAAATMAAALGAGGPRALKRAIFGTGLAVGISGIAFHAYNILKRPGGLSWNNLFYGAPFAAPGALAFSAILGLTADRLPALRHEPPHLRRRFAEAIGHTLAGGLLATTSEVWLLHLRGAYHDPFMYLPVTVVPTAAASLALASAHPNPATLRAARVLLNSTALLGVLGTGLHAYGIKRNMGGFHNWTQMLLQGPPIPAPPSFTGLALGGLGAISLLGDTGG